MGLPGVVVRESGATRRDMELERADDKQCEDGITCVAAEN